MDSSLAKGLCVDGKFRRLYDLSENKSVKVVEMWSLGWVESDDSWKRRRKLLVWEEEHMGECSLLLSSIFLRWVWKINEIGVLILIKGTLFEWLIIRYVL